MICADVDNRPEPVKIYFSYAARQIRHKVAYPSEQSQKIWYQPESIYTNKKEEILP